ncbi:MAG TPA: hypothetical protein VH592_13045 [Gemmataceae bacterium]|jgi:hypothetical protein
MSLIPNRFLFRVCYPCRYVADIPGEGNDDLLDLPEECRLDSFADMDERRSFADVRIAWNEGGLALQVQVRGKEQTPVGDIARPRSSDGVTIWVDTRDARTSHRASRYCHQFHFLATGGGADKDEPAFVQSKINRALYDAPTVATDTVPFQFLPRTGGYRLEAFLPAAALNGFDPEQNPRLGIHVAVHDQEMGEQSLSVGDDFPWAEDPSLWSVLELVKEAE